MATIKHDGNFGVGDTIVYEYSSSTLYGQKLLKYVFVDEIGEYRYITEPVKIRDNEVIQYLHGALEIHDPEQMPKDLPLRWTKDPEFKKGDILVGTHKSTGVRVVLYYVSSSHVERLSGTGESLVGDTGWASLAHYQGELKDIKVHTTALTSVKFSTL